MSPKLARNSEQHLETKFMKEKGMIEKIKEVMFVLYVVSLVLIRQL